MTPSAASAPLKVLDLFAGLEGWSAPFRERGHEVCSVDIDERFDVDLHADVFELDAADLAGPFDIVLASPPCEAFSVLRIGQNWTRDHQPRNDKAREAVRLVQATVDLIAALEPRFWIVENPVGKLRRLPPMAPFYRRTVTYCQYGAPWRKPTDLWGAFPPSLEFRPRCRPGQSCHVPAPRGSRTTIQSDTTIENKHPRVREWLERDGLHPLRRRAHEDAALAGTWNRRVIAAMRAKIPPALALDVCLAAERDLEAPGPPLGQLMLGEIASWRR